MAESVMYTIPTGHDRTHSGKESFQVVVGRRHDQRQFPYCLESRSLKATGERVIVVGLFIGLHGCIFTTEANASAEDDEFLS